jgi:TetR/AcrR family transcriptional regulator, fatty acid metabolism regulator protein
MTPSPSKPRKKRMPRDERIARIIEVTRELLAAKGYDNLLTTEIAERCGLSEAAIYKYFDSKRELLISVAEQWYHDMLAEEHRSFEGMSAFEALRHVIWRHFSIVKRDPELTRFILMDLRPDPAYRSMPLYQLNRQLLAQIPAVLRHYMDTGDLRQDIPIHVVRDAIFGAIEHQTWAFLRKEGDFSIEESTNSIAKLLYGGLRTPDAAPEGSPQEDVLRRLERVADRMERSLPAMTENQRKAGR